MKTIEVIECRHCRGSYFAGKTRITLHPGNEDKLPDELSFMIRKIPKCENCKQDENRTKGRKAKRIQF
jgi:hypothetical protein